MPRGYLDQLLRGGSARHDGWLNLHSTCSNRYHRVGGVSFHVALACQAHVPLWLSQRQACARSLSMFGLFMLPLFSSGPHLNRSPQLQIWTASYGARQATGTPARQLCQPWEEADPRARLSRHPTSSCQRTSHPNYRPREYGIRNHKKRGATWYDLLVSINAVLPESLWTLPCAKEDRLIGMDRFK